MRIACLGWLGLLLPLLVLVGFTLLLPDVLAARLAGRGRERAADIARRLERASWPVPDDALIVTNNSGVDEGTVALLAAIDQCVSLDLTSGAIE